MRALCFFRSGADGTATACLLCMALQSEVPPPPRRASASLLDTILIAIVLVVLLFIAVLWLDRKVRGEL